MKDEKRRPDFGKYLDGMKINWRNRPRQINVDNERAKARAFSNEEAVRKAFSRGH